MSAAPAVAPTPLVCVAITLAAWLITQLVVAGLAPDTGWLLAVALGTTIGFGGIGTLVARAVPEPAELRLGLCSVPVRDIGLVLLLVPLVLLTSELDNWVAEWLPRPEPETRGETDPDALALLALETALFVALLRPVIEEFFFRGVLQQGAVAALGAPSGVVLQALLFAMVRATFYAGDPYLATSQGAQGFVEGGVLGWLRLGTGSILPGIVLQVIAGSLSMLLTISPDALVIPGFSETGGHTPLAWLLPSMLSVGLALAWVQRGWQAQPPLPDPPEEEEEDGPPTLF